MAAASVGPGSSETHAKDCPPISMYRELQLTIVVQLTIVGGHDNDYGRQKRVRKCSVENENRFRLLPSTERKLSCEEGKKKTARNSRLFVIDVAHNHVY